MGTCPVPGPRPTGGQRLAHAGVSGETRAVVTWKVMPGSWTRGQPAAIDEGDWGGSWAGQGTPVQRRRHGPDCRHGEKRWGRMWPRWAVGPLGFRQLRAVGAPVPWLSQAMVLRRHPCRGAAISLSELLFPGPEWQSPQAAVDGPDGLRYKGQGHGVCNAHPGYVPNVRCDRPDGVQRGTHGVYHLIDNHGDDTGRGEEDEMEYVPVSLPIPRDGQGFSCSFGFSGVAGLRLRLFRMVSHGLLCWFEYSGDMTSLAWRLASGPPPAGAVPGFTAG